MLGYVSMYTLHIAVLVCADAVYCGGGRLKTGSVELIIGLLWWVYRTFLRDFARALPVLAENRWSNPLVLGVEPSSLPASLPF